VDNHRDRGLVGWWAWRATDSAFTIADTAGGPDEHAVACASVQECPLKLGGVALAATRRVLQFDDDRVDEVVTDVLEGVWLKRL
jgi:hypothetical protein